MLPWRGLAVVAVFGVAIAVLAFPQLNLFGITRGSNDTALGLTLGLDLSGGSHLVYRIIPPTDMPLSPEDTQGIREVINSRVNEFGVNEATVQLLSSSGASSPDRLLVQIPVRQTQPTLEIRFTNRVPYDPEDPEKATNLTTFTELEQVVSDTGDEMEAIVKGIPDYADAVFGYPDGERDIIMAQADETGALSRIEVSYLFTFEDLRSEERDLDGNLLRSSDADFIATKLRERFRTRVNVNYAPTFESVTSAIDTSSLTTAVNTIGSSTTAQQTLTFPTVAEITAALVANDFPNAKVFDVDDPSTPFAEYGIEIDDLRPGGLDSSGNPIAAGDVLLSRALFEAGNFLAVTSVSGNFTYVSSGGIEDAKALIGSTALLEFRERDCASQSSLPEGLNSGEWEVLRCTDPSYFTERGSGIEASDLDNAYYSFRPEAGHVVNIEFNQTGADAFYDSTLRISQSNNESLLAIYLDGRELVSPGASRPIPDGRAYISGNFGQEEARTIGIQLRSGALPASLELIQERNVDAVLGTDSLMRSVIAGGIGLLLLILFMVLYYKIPGLVAALTLIFYAVVLIALFKVIPVTLTLSGAAAVILSLGFAVDANILISERVKEELRTGQLLIPAIIHGFNRAWPSIRDGNLSTIIIALVLFWFGDRFGTTVIQGFALTLGIGILLSMMTAFFVNRVIMRYIAYGLLNRINLFVPVAFQPPQEKHIEVADGVSSSTGPVTKATQFNVLEYRKILGIVSAAVVLVSIILLIVFRLPLGIDFASGTSINYQWEITDPGQAEVRAILSEQGFPEAIVQTTGGGSYFVRTKELGEGDKSAIDQALTVITGEQPTTLDITTVGQAIAQETVLYSIAAVLVSSVFVMLYVMWAFRKVPHPYRYAIAAIVALTHDVLITVGIFILFGFGINSQVNAPFIVAILTVIGYSVNDTIVVFDRIRENALLVPGRPFYATVYLSVKETIVRSLGTSITTLLVVLAMLLFGGQTLRDFLLILLIGIIVGTYSSIFIASALLIAWEQNELARFVPKFLRRGTTSGIEAQSNTGY